MRMEDGACAACSHGRKPAPNATSDSSSAALACGQSASVGFGDSGMARFER